MDSLSTIDLSEFQNTLTLDDIISSTQDTVWTTENAGQTWLTSATGSSVHPGYGAVPNVTIGGMSATGINATSPIWTTNTTAGSYTIGGNIQPNNTVHIKGKDADLLINDKSLKTWMEKVEERLNILTPNPELEKEWDQLRKLGERYRKLEKKCQEQSDMWKKLRSMPKPNINL